MKFCPSCGSQLNDDVRFCNSCGAPQNLSMNTQPASNSSGFAPQNSQQSGEVYFGYNTTALVLQIVSIVLMIVLTFVTYFAGMSIAENEVRSQGFYYGRKTVDDYQPFIILICVILALAAVMVIVTTIAIARNKLIISSSGISGEAYVYVWNKKFNVSYNDIISVKHRATRIIIKTTHGTFRCYINNINQAKAMIEARIGNRAY